MSTYRAMFFCSNCKHRTRVNVPKGTTKSAYASKEKCPNCGCQTLRAIRA